MERHVKWGRKCWLCSLTWRARITLRMMNPLNLYYKNLGFFLTCGVWTPTREKKKIYIYIYIYITKYSIIWFWLIYIYKKILLWSSRRREFRRTRSIIKVLQHPPFCFTDESGVKSLILFCVKKEKRDFMLLLFRC